MKINPIQINDLPLRDLFDRLREVGFLLGIDDYQLLLQSLMAGFGLGSKQALGRLCKSLWVKSQKESEIFDYYFDAYFKSYFIEGIGKPILKKTATLAPTLPPNVPPTTEDNLTSDTSDKQSC